MSARLAVLTAVLVGAAPVGGQPPPKPAVVADPPGQANRDAMKKLDFLAGKWKGEASMTFGPSRTEKFTQTEAVEYRLGGTILVVEGVGTGKLPGQDKEGVVHNAFAVISYDADKKEYSVKAYKAEGVSVTGWMKVGDKKFEWGFTDPGRKVDVKYTVTLTEKGEWNEVGDSSLDGGKKWNRFYEMTVTKVKE